MVDVLQVMLGAIVFLLMLGLGSTLTVKQFRRALRQWKAPLTGFCCQVILMPLLSFAMAEIFDVSNEVGLSVVIVGACPGGSTSNLFTYWSQGDLSLSITMTAISSLLAFGTLPLLLVIYGPAFTDATLAVDFVAVVQALALVLVPVLLGMYARSRSERVAKWLERLGSGAGVVFIVAAVIYGSISEASIWQSEASVWIIAVFLLFFGAGFGYAISYFALKMHPKQCRTIALETGVQNSTVAIAILAFSFPATDDKSSERLTELLRFPLLYSFFLIMDSILLTAIFFYVSRYDPPLPPHLQPEEEDTKDSQDNADQDEEILEKNEADASLKKAPVESV